MKYNGELSRILRSRSRQFPALNFPRTHVRKLKRLLFQTTTPLNNIMQLSRPALLPLKTLNALVDHNIVFQIFSKFYCCLSSESQGNFFVECPGITSLWYQKLCIEYPRITSYVSYKDICMKNPGIISSLYRNPYIEYPGISCWWYRKLCIEYPRINCLW